jgi:FkbM family methyltransferase
MKQRIKYFFLLVFSRPTFFPYLLKLQKFIFWISNRASAATFLLEKTGEIAAFEKVFSLIKHNQPLIMFDCGAHHGHYTELMIRTLKKNGIESFTIYLFEPAQIFQKELTQKFLNDSRCRLVNKAVSDSIGQSILYYPWAGAGSASLAGSNENSINNTLDNAVTEIVDIITLDDFCVQEKITKIDFLKLDIEGFEFRALLGLKKLMQQQKVQIIQFEQGIASLTTKQLLKDFWDEFQEYYNFYIILQNGLAPLKQYSADLEIFYGATNYMMILKNIK